jgi:hypothetical protein
MIYITQLIYLKPGEEDAFNQFESIAIPIIAKYNGRLLLRMRPGTNSILIATIDVPYEIHLVEFLTDKDLKDYMADEERKACLHLKEQSVEKVSLIKGILM